MQAPIAIKSEKALEEFKKQYCADMWPYAHRHFEAGFIVGQSYPSEETARKIWDAGLRYQLKESTETDAPLIPDFETFYKQLIEGK